MRTTVEIDDELLARAQEVAGTTTKRSTIDYALRELVRRLDRRRALELRGMGWEGDLSLMRTDNADGIVDVGS